MNGEKRRSYRVVMGAAGLALLSACGGGGSEIVLRAVPDKTSLAKTCVAMAGVTVPAARIGIASGDATVSAAVLVAAVSTAPAFAEYCKVQGSIASVTPGADPIRFQLNLPTTWNEKAVMVGGGGFNGSLIDAVAPLRDAALGQPQPITQGFATFGTDSGHDGTSYNAADPAKFALNDEMFLNFAHRSYKKVRDAAQELMQRYYLRKPSKQYFYGGSEGGREGLAMAQRYPQDFDGIVSVVPVIQWTGLFNGFINYQLPQFSGGAIGASKVRLVADHVNGACDALDNSADGVVSNYLACPSRIRLQTLRCLDGKDTGDTCLSDAQLAVLAASYGPTTMPFPLANGIITYPGRLYGGEIQLGGEGVSRWVTTGSVPNLPPTAADARGVIYGSSYARFVIAKDGSFDLRTWNASKFKARIQEVSELMDSTNPDLSAFRARGGKLIIRENAGDWAQSPMAGIEYYQSVVVTMTQPVVDDFMRLYVSPASNHGGTAASLNTGAEVATRHDLLATLDQWVIQGVAPSDALVQVQNSATAPFATLASRPMCRYPNYPAYVSGDVRKADSYRCVRS